MPRQRRVASKCGRVLRSTHLPLCNAQIHLSSTLGGKSLVVLQAAAHDAAGHSEVAVVAVTRDFDRQSRGPSFRCRTEVVEIAEAGSIETHVRPAAFHANVILTACGGGVV